MPRKRRAHWELSKGGFVKKAPLWGRRGIFGPSVELFDRGYGGVDRVKGVLGLFYKCQVFGLADLIDHDAMMKERAEDFLSFARCRRIGSRLFQ